MMRINLGFWDTDHLPLPYANINTYLSLRAKCWLRGGVVRQFLETLIDQKMTTVFLLATKLGKVGLSCLFWIACFVPARKIIYFGHFMNSLTLTDAKAFPRVSPVCEPDVGALEL